MELLQERDRERRVDFVCAPGVRASTDPTGIGVVLTNLIENAWKYSSRVAHAHIEFGVQRAGRSARSTSCATTAPASRCSTPSGLFKPFQRLHGPDEYPGSGIGLATVERLIRRLGGRVWVESAPDQGATFYFTLDAAVVAGRAHSRENVIRQASTHCPSFCCSVTASIFVSPSKRQIVRSTRVLPPCSYRSSGKRSSFCAGCTSPSL